MCLDIIKCDICGKFYEEYGKSTIGNLFNEPNTIEFIYAGHSDMRLNRYDCCPECMAKINRTINDLKEGNPDHSRELQSL